MSHNQGPCRGLIMLLLMILAIIVAAKSDSTYVDVGVFLIAVQTVRTDLKGRG